MWIRRFFELEILAWIDEDWLFSTNTGAPQDSLHVSKNFHKLVISTTLPKIALHETRHTFVSLAALAKTPVVEVSRIIGHSSIQVTMDIYAHLFPEQTRTVVDGIANLFSKIETAV